MRPAYDTPADGQPAAVRARETRDGPEAGDRFEHAPTGRHYEVARAGPTELRLDQTDGADTRWVDRRAFDSRPFVPEP